MYKVLGRHAILNIYGVNPDLLDDPVFADDVLSKAALVGGATILRSEFHEFGPGFGITGILFLSESHISIHSWPEYKCALIDIFMCGNCLIQESCDLILDNFNPMRYNLQILDRGIEHASDCYATTKY